MIKQRVKPIMDVVVKIAELISTAFMVVMMMTLMWQVVTRFVIKVPSTWTEELARETFIYMALFGAAVAVKNSTHFGMTLFTDKLRGKARNIYFKYVVNAIILISSVMMFKYGCEFTFTFGPTRVSPTFLVPMTWFFMAIPLSSGLMILFSLYNILFGDYSHDLTLQEEVDLEVKKHEMEIKA